MSFAQGENPDTVRKAIGTVIRRRREAVGLGLKAASDAAHISAAHLSEVERGLTEVSVERLLSIARVLSMPIGELYLELARELGAGGREEPAWHSDPKMQLQLASRELNPQALRTVADFTLYLASMHAQPKRRIGFTVEG